MSRFIIKIINFFTCHHSKENLNHCLRFSYKDHSVFFCSRCLGLYPMALLLLFIWLKFSVTFNDSLEKNLILYSLLPLFLDWSLTTFHLIKSNNVIRFFSGIIASFGLSRWWALWLTQSHLDVFYSVARIYSITIALVFLVMIYRYRPLKNEKGMSV